MTVRLVPLALGVARAALEGDCAEALSAVGLRAGRGWPHADTADALRPADAQHDATGCFLIVLDDEVIGECGWRGPPDHAGEVEIGYGVSPHHRGRGHGGAAVRTLLAWVQLQPRVSTVRAEVQQGNEPSRRLLVRLGFELSAEALPPYVCYLRRAPIN